jgi:hypothetical protein
MGNWQRLRAESAVYHISDVARDVIGGTLHPESVSSVPGAQYRNSQDSSG